MVTCSGWMGWLIDSLVHDAEALRKTESTPLKCSLRIWSKGEDKSRSSSDDRVSMGEVVMGTMGLGLLPAEASAAASARHCCTW